jgi:small basic protein (TIGR04137 family)
MSIHRSLRGADTLTGERSVLSRVERILKLAKDGRVDTEQGSAWGLPKVRTKFRVAGAKKKEEKPAEGAASPAAAAATGAAPAGAKPAAGKPAAAAVAPAAKGGDKKDGAAKKKG